MVPLDLLGVCPLNRGRMGVSCYHVHEVARPGLLAATNVRMRVPTWAALGRRAVDIRVLCRRIRTLSCQRIRR